MTLLQYYVTLLQHNVTLIDKRSYYGINGTALKHFQNYLTDQKKQFVEINNVKSDTLILKTGVQQGSILGLLLFIIYINDVAHAGQIFYFIIYADDTNLSSSLKIILKDTKIKLSIETIINNELGYISNWLKTNELSLNVKKTKYMIFHTAPKKLNKLHLTINNTIIERVTQFDFLGLTLNENFTWKDHINKISNKISQSLGILNKLKHILPINAKTLIYISLIPSHLTFGILAWVTPVNESLNYKKMC